ncbi:putative transcriptional corepressor of histone genes (Hir3) [Aspergillus lucknowensis]|uniref:Histone transcription regulator 3 homolog n=1 Tax=Aspergillus lucknowensis TaxID=176173 RepID=A0ABR4LGJ3_9EURO
MSTWAALNIEPDEAIEEEVDDTKEIQIEEALKLYQNALKLHSQGPQFYEQAAEAYQELLHSEIFRYPESLSDFKRVALRKSEPQFVESLNDVTIDDTVTAAVLGDFNINDSTSSTLQQTIFLSYKNHGQYTLDALRALLQDVPKLSGAAPEILSQVTERSRTALASFAEALERDDTDLTLWRQSARLGSALQSYRLTRFCLESVLADDDNRLEVRTEQLGLEETLAEEGLRKTLQSVQDRLSVSLVPLKKPKKGLIKFLQRQIDLYPYLPSLPDNLRAVDPSRHPIAFRASEREIKIDSLTWEATGKAILRLISVEDDTVHSPGTSVTISLPADSPELKAITNTTQRRLSKPHSDDDHPQDGQVADEGQSTGMRSVTGCQGLEQTADHGDDQSSVDQRAEKQLMEFLEVQSSQPQQSVDQQEDMKMEEVEAKSPEIPCRKRSSASAIADDQAERLRVKSRRTRLRDSLAEASTQADEILFDQAKYYEDLLDPYVQADDGLFGTVGPLLSKLGVEALGSLEDLRKHAAYANERMDSPDTTITPTEDADHLLLGDLRDIIKNWDEGKSQVMQQTDTLSGIHDIQGMDGSGLAVFLEHSKKPTHKLKSKQTFSGEEGLVDFITAVNTGRFTLQDVAFNWLKCLLRPDYERYTSNVGLIQDWSVIESSYVAFQWPATLKDAVLQLLLHEDEFVYGRLENWMTTLEHQILRQESETPFRYSSEHFADLEMIQAIFELHLDLYSPMNTPSNNADQQTRILQYERLQRWCILARTALTHFIDHGPVKVSREKIILRHIWASIFHSNMGVDAQREHTLLCLQDLRHLFNILEDPVLPLTNNTMMYELSSESIDKEISKLNSMDFFLKIFNPDSDDPVRLIETIEPIVEPSSVQIMEEDADDQQSLQRREMCSFLDRGDATLRLFLWRRLQDAYKKIDYAPKVISCYFRSIETIFNELSSTAYLEEHSEHRQTTLLRWLKSLDGVLSKTVSAVLHESDKAYECFDMEHVRSSMSAVASLIKLLHSLVLYEDSVRVGQVPKSDLRGSLAKSLENFKDKLRVMLVRCWILLYTLLKEAISQNGELFDEPFEDRIYYLRAVHNALGIRKICGRSSRQFLKLMKSELFGLEVKQDIEADICQILYDIHGVKLAPNDNLLSDHGCSSEKLDRSTAVTMIDFVMKQAMKINIKDLSKSELKSTIDKMQQYIGSTKSSPPVTYNRRILNAYMKSPISPSELFRAVRGVADIPLIPVPTENALIAKKGWYFLLGHAALTRFRSQKRLSPVPTTDLDEAISWFKHDLEHGTSRWETWYRLAQTWDSKVEEDITWSADKINNNRTELVTWQRNAIHCYAMAVATAARTAEPEPETRALLADLHTDFGIRLYSSSREPLSMGAFSLVDFSRHYSNEESQQMYEGKPFKEMRVYSVWKLASYLLRRAIADKPKNWMTHYMLSKCLWKMFSCDDSVRGSSKRISLDSVLDSLLDGIDALPQRKDSRSEPIFEPHYKLVSIVHKLVKREVLTPVEASKTLLATLWARKVQPPEDMASWKKYIFDVLKNLKNADKSNWHHRMAVRAAHIIYDDDKDATAAAGAKGELTQQIFTKTMTIQVWRPEYERPGRHFVYTTRYAYFFVALLDQLDDRANLDQLLRRVRKKQGDFINHTKLWEDMCLTYARVIRRAGHISEGHEEGVFKPIGWEEFVANTARLEDLSQLAPESSSLLELLRDAIELKKLNNNLMKVALLEDLIADLYSRFYEINMPQVIEQVNQENKEKMKVDHILMTTDGGGDVSTPPTSAPTSEAPAPRGRTKGIARRDIQKRAETIVSRKVAPRAPATRVGTTTETEPTVTAAPTGPRTVVEIPPRHLKADEAGSAHQSDIPNSVHDSADDESELSEIDEEKLSKLAADRKTLFPNLQDRGSLDPDSEMSVQASPAGDGPNEGGEMYEDAHQEGEGVGDPDPDVGEGDGEGEDGEEPGDGDDEGEDIGMEDGGEEGDEAGGEVGENDDDAHAEGPFDVDMPTPEPEVAPGRRQANESENMYDSELATEL